MHLFPLLRVAYLGCCCFMKVVRVRLTEYIDLGLGTHESVSYTYTHHVMDR
jgi:hypothetical protein